MTLALADDFLVLAATVLLLLEIYALRMAHQLLQLARRAGQGEYLLRIVFRFGFFVVLAQTSTVINAILRYADQMETYDTRLVILLASELLLAAAFLWTVWELHRLPADRYAGNPSTGGGDPCECICKQIHNPSPATRAPIDQGDDDTLV